MKFKGTFKRTSVSLAAAVLCSVVVPIAVSTPVTAHTGIQQDDAWYGVDDPVLEGPDNQWWNVQGGGVDGDYAYTYGNRDLTSYQNRAVWHMGHRHGWQPIYVYVPISPVEVQATVRYRIYKNEEWISTVELNQSRNKGWQQLGIWEFNGAVVRIEARDNDAAQIFDRNSQVSSRMGIDKISMICWSSCNDSTEHPSNVSSLQTRYDSLQIKYNRLVASFESYHNCIYLNAGDTGVELSRLADYIDTEGITERLASVFPVIGHLVSAIITSTSPLTDALRSLGITISARFGCKR